MITITKYSELIKFITKFKENYFDLLIIFSKGGLGKTYNSEKILIDEICKINSHVTPLGLFQYGFEYKDKLMWFDDVESLFNNDKLIGLIKQFSQTQKTKYIKFTTSRILKKGDIDIPTEYETKSKVLMTCNSINRVKNQSVKALLDRGLVVFFSPSKDEIIKYIKSSFEEIDEDIIVELKKKKTFSIRDYIKADQLKRANFENWKDIIGD